MVRSVRAVLFRRVPYELVEHDLHVPSGHTSYRDRSLRVCNDFAWHNHHTHWTMQIGEQGEWHVFHSMGLGGRDLLYTAPNKDAAIMWMIHNV